MFKNLGEAALSLLALPFLLPWYASERIFEFLIQPFIFRRFGLKAEKRTRRYLKLALIGLALAVLGYLGYKAVKFVALFPSAKEALFGFKAYFVLILNDTIRVFQLALWPVNVTMTFMHGGQVQALHLLLALYICFLPVLVLFHMGLRLTGTVSSLSRAVKLRNQAVRDVDLVYYAGRAQPDQIFLGLDMTQGNAPFYAKRQWLRGHAQIIGSSGSGKTQSIIHPVWFQEMRRNVATFALDGKGSRQNLDKIYTIATSLAQGHEVLYFNPSDPERSATYNPLLRGSAVENRQKIIASLNWAGMSANTRERITFYLDLIIRAIKESGRFLSLEEIFQYLSSKPHVHQQMRQVRDRRLYEALLEMHDNYSRFQNETELLASTLRELTQADFSWLLDTNEPEIEIAKIYQERKDCYFTLPMHSGNPSMRFLGQLILQDMSMTFAQILMQAGEGGKEGVLIIDEMVNFVSPSFVELLRNCSNAHVSVLYTNQSFAELSNPELNLHPSFAEELADHTNALFCFHLGSPESIKAVLDRIGQAPSESGGKAGATKGGAPKKGAAEKTAAEKSTVTIDANFLKHLEIGRCIVAFRQPRLTAVLKTGYFKIDKPLQFERAESRQASVAA